MSLSIRPVTKNNWLEIAKLKVHDAQSHFVASNVYSIAEAQFGFDESDGKGHWDMYPHGIYDGDAPVGFLMYGYNFSYPGFQAYIMRLMVDEKHQAKGYGYFGMKSMLDIFRADPRIAAVGISYEPNNEVARKLYERIGFIETGEMLDGEVVAVYRIHRT
jgi:diamine N-acetyltransferase